MVYGGPVGFPIDNAQDAYHHNNMDRHLKNKSVHDRLEKRVVEQDWADHDERRYMW